MRLGIQERISLRPVGYLDVRAGGLVERHESQLQMFLFFLKYQNLTVHGSLLS